VTFGSAQIGAVVTMRIEDYRRPQHHTFRTVQPRGNLISPACAAAGGV
jgi:hypothetical protein